MRRNKNTRRTAANSTTGKRARRTRESVTEYKKACNYVVLVFLAAFAVMSAGAVWLGW